MSEPERCKLWVRAGGRCTLCKKDLMEGSLTYEEMPLGEGAHIVGQKQTARSPRGEDAMLPTERDLASNILLACSNCHTEIDKQIALSVMTIDELRHRKAQHENEIAHLTGLTSDRRSSVLRVFGHVKNAPVVLDRAEAARAVIRSGERFPLFMPAFDRQGIEVDLRRLPGEDRATPAYYAAATQMITDALDRMQQGIERGDVVHLSVFAFARLPLLVYLGAHLDDAVAAEIYQRHRATNGWEWPQAGRAQVFTTSMLKTGAVEASDGALIVNLSGNTRVEDLPESLHDAPVWELSPDRRDEDVIASRESLAAFESAVRQFFTDLESTHKRLARLHVFGPIPISAAVTLGRVLKAPDLRPSVVTYDWATDAYQFAVEV
jgi:hypothetical protein